MQSIRKRSRQADRLLRPQADPQLSNHHRYHPILDRRRLRLQLQLRRIRRPLRKAETNDAAVTRIASMLTFLIESQIE